MNFLTTAHLLPLFLCSPLAPKAECFNAPTRFVVHRRGHRRRRGVIAPLPVVAGEDDGEIVPGSVACRTALGGNATERIHHNNRMLSRSEVNGREIDEHKDHTARRTNNSGALRPPSPSAKMSKNKINGSSGQQDTAALEERMKEAQLVEKLLLDAVRKMRRNSRSRSRRARIVPPAKLFPSVRQCNAALATFGDGGDFRRALRLFAQMKKSASLFSVVSTRIKRSSSSPSSSSSSSSSPAGGDHSFSLGSIDLVHDPPKPTLVTYSTLMSRAVSLGKPRVALRLWNLMRNQPNFYLKVASKKRSEGLLAREDLAPSELRRLEIEDDAIVPDVIFCNTLMNAYAKLGDHVAARSVLDAMLGDDIGGGDGDDATTTTTRRRHEGIPPTLDPTVVTYNTLADACKTSGELGAALEVPELMNSRARRTGDDSLLPDARTYTNLISTVARKNVNARGARDVRSGGERDPDMAFALLNRMVDEGISPNGVTYCALIDVCSRCRRVDLALNGLRIMLKQKSKASLASSSTSRQKNRVHMYHQQALHNEVGAWTAAINACGKMGRVDTAARLFRTMQKLGVKPNAVTCGCLSDCLLKATPIRMAETMEVLQYMKREGLVPGEVMYTSLMGVALSLAERESGSVIRKDGLQVNLIDKFDRSTLLPPDAEDTTSEAIFLYTELMRCLIQDRDEDMILKVFLLFQEMRNAGATPDVACYNLLLRACTFSSDVQRAQDVLRRMDADGVEPNRASWREALRAAMRATRSDVADAIWDAAVTYENRDSKPFMPKASDVELLLNVYLQEIRNTSNHEVRNSLNEKIVGLYEGILSGSEERGLHHKSLSLDEVEGNQHFMLSVLRAAVSLELHGVADSERNRARNLAVEIAALEVFQRKLSSRVDRASKKALQVAQDWLYSYNY